MAYFNGYPATYQSPYQYPYQSQQNSGLIWIQGEAAAKSYLVSPNTTVALWDSEAMTVYLKSADASGMPSMKILDYTIRGNTTPSAPVSVPEGNSTDYATKAEMDALRDELDVLRADMEKYSARRRRAKEETDDA